MCTNGNNPERSRSLQPLNTNLTVQCCQLRGDGEPGHQGGDRAGGAGEGHEAPPGGRGGDIFNIIILISLSSLS